MINKLMEFALKNRTFVVLIFIAVCIGGTLSIINLPIDAFPDLSPNLVQVFAEVEATPTEIVEKMVTRPIESAMLGVPGVKRIRSITTFGLSRVNVYFKDNMDIYKARQLVAEKIVEAEEHIPKGLDMPHGVEMGSVASGTGALFYYRLEAKNYNNTELRSLQDEVVKPNLQSLPGIANVVSQGGNVKQYIVKVSPYKLLGYGVTLDDVTEAITKNNQDIGAGLIEKGEEEWIVRSIGSITKIDDIKGIVIGFYQDNPVYIRDVADVNIEGGFRRGIASMNGEKEIVVGWVYKLHRANSFEVIKQLKKRILEINETLPEDVKIVPIYNQGKLVQNSVRTIYNSLLLGLIFVCIVSLLFLGKFKNIIVVVMSLPFALLLSFIVFYFCGISGDLLSLGGLAIGLGMIVDATIIIVEKMHRKLHSESLTQPPIQMIFEGCREVGRPIFFAIGIIIFVFLPIFTLQGIEGKMFRPLAFAVCIAMVGSLIYALLIAPVLYSLFPEKIRDRKKEDFFLTKYYEKFLLWLLGRWKMVLTIVIMLMIGGLFIFTRMGKIFTPVLREGTIDLLAYFDPNISLNEISKVSSRIEKEMLSIPEIKYVTSDIGYGEVGPHVHQTNFSCMQLGLHPKKKWKTAKKQEDIVDMIRSKLKGYVGVAFNLSQPIQHELDDLVAGTGSQVSIRIFGPDLDVLQKQATMIRDSILFLEFAKKGAVDIFLEQVAGQKQLQITLLRDEIARNGINIADVQRLIHDAIGGTRVGKVFEQDKTTDIMVVFDESHRKDVEAYENLLINTPHGDQVPLAELAQINLVEGMRQSSHENGSKLVAVQCNVSGRDEGGFVEELRQVITKRVKLPPGYVITYGGKFELRKAANKRLTIIVPITLFLIFMMIFGAFNSIPKTLLVFLNIPLSFVGGVLSLALWGEYLSIPASIGFIVLFGIAIEDVLVLLSRIQYLRDKGYTLQEAVVQGSLSKLRPVLMTSITTFLGLLPMILATGPGAEVQRPLAIVVLGGLASSTALTLLVIPTLYLWIEKKEKR